jgi:hypothetical protein
MNGRVDAERVLDAFLAPEADQLPDRVMDGALAEIARTPQRRAMRAPWRLPNMLSRIPASGVAVVALAVVVGTGGLIYLNVRSSSGQGGPGPTASSTSSPAPSATRLPPTPTQVAPGITSWRTYSSAIYGDAYRSIGYPSDWSMWAPASRKWRAGDAFPAGDLQYADIFASPGEGDAGIALFVWSMPAGSGATIETVEGLKAWADTFCRDVLASSCEGFTQQAVPWAWASGNYYSSAILVKTADHQYAFLGDCNSCLLVGSTDRVTVVVVAREDSFPPAAPYGGSVQLLKSILTTVNVR